MRCERTENICCGDCTDVQYTDAGAPSEEERIQMEIKNNRCRGRNSTGVRLPGGAL